MKVAIVNDWFLKYATEQAIGLRRAGAEVLVVCRDHFQEFDGDRGEWETLLQQLAESGVSTQVVSGRTLSSSAVNTGIASRRRLAAWGAEIVHAHPNYDPWLHLASLRCPLVLTVHDPQPHPGQPRHGPIIRAIGRGWRQRADGFVVHGRALAEELRPSVGHRPVVAIPHGVTPAAAPYPIPPAPTVLFFGRLEPYKGLTVLIAAMREVWTRRPEVELVVAGNGPSADQVPDDPRIRRMFSYIPESDVDGLLRGATLLVAPYLQASQSGVVSLAVARGIPAIVSDQGALPDLAVDPDLVVPAGDHAALARAVLAHLDHGAELRQRIHAMARDSLSWDATARAALRFYAELQSDPRQQSGAAFRAPRR